MKAAAAEVGIDPALVERAARLLPANSSASLFERLIGGPLRHSRESHLPVRLDEARAAQLLAAVQMSAGRPGSGHSSSAGMVWHARDDMEALSVTAQPVEGDTSVTVRLDRSGIMAALGVATLVIGPVAAAAASITIGSEVAPVFGAVAGVSIMSGILALARSYWAVSTNRVRGQIGGMLDAVSRVVEQSESPPPAPGEIGDSSSDSAAPHP